MINKKGILLIYPRLGPYDRVIKDMPLSLIYASRVAQREGFSITVIDQRLLSDWREVIREELKKNPVLVGLSVMTGKPIKHALEISQFIKDNSSIPVVWGGIHPTIMPEQTLANKNIDIVVKGEGEVALCKIAKSILGGKNNLSAIQGISFKDRGGMVHNEISPRIDFSDLLLPDYDLVNFSDYARFESEERFFSVITSRGCPHRCGFCYNVPSDKNCWQSEPVEKTIDHMQLIIDKYQPTCFSVIDSDFFVDLKRAIELFTAIEKRGWKVSFDFRGVRVDEIYRADDELLFLMQRIGVEHLHIGAESGSQRILDLMQKGIKVEQIIELNRRLKNFKGIVPTYNFFSGIPTETKDDLKCSTKLIIQLIKENPDCLISAYNRFTPYPGTALFDLAIEYGLKAPESLEDWTGFDQSKFSNYSPWLSKEREKLLDMFYLTTFFIDKKIQTLFVSKKLKYKILRLIALLYRPIARFRLKKHFTLFFAEIKLKSIFERRQ